MWASFGARRFGFRLKVSTKNRIASARSLVFFTRVGWAYRPNKSLTCISPSVIGDWIHSVLLFYLFYLHENAICFSPFYNQSRCYLLSDYTNLVSVSFAFLSDKTCNISSYITIRNAWERLHTLLVSWWAMCLSIFQINNLAPLFEAKVIH